MKLAKIAKLAACFAVGGAAAHSLGTEDGAAAHNKEFSMPELVRQTKLPSQWLLKGDATFEEGRIVLTPREKTKGGVWHKKSYELQGDFTVEWALRARGHTEKSAGGVAFWLVTEDTAADTGLYFGPARFDGLQILVDSDGPLHEALTARLSDGSKPLTREEAHKNTFGSCIVPYKDSDVPTMVRLSYDSTRKLLKVQIDHNVCLQTQKVQLPSGKYQIGVTADNAVTPEVFELLKFDLYNVLTAEATMPNAVAMPQPKLVLASVNQETGEKQVKETNPLERMASSFTNVDIYKKLDGLEGKLLANDVGELFGHVKKLQELQRANTQKLDMLLENIQRLTRKSGETGGDNFEQFYQFDSKLEQLLKEQQQFKEAAKQQASMHQAGPHVDDIVQKLLIWMIPLGLIMLVMAYYTFQIRQDIVKAKLL
ncbi:AaceriABR243Wp [[Ashbya] aceris (nom. inval.)]|nr:AaceriABR243Wp [[Ashbya] aceris (nom. inval.)]